jgi:glycerol-3-phosphate dehydrogenase
VKLVQSSLRERAWWIEHAPQFAKPIEITLPVYNNSHRSTWKIRTGLRLYDWLAGRHRLGRHCWYGRSEALRLCPELNPDGLKGVFTFRDAQMQDRELGLWAAEQAAARGVAVRTHSPVHSVNLRGSLVSNTELQFDRIVNVAGPWAKKLLEQSGVPSAYDLDLVRGSHLLLKQGPKRNYMVEVPEEERVCFVLNYQGTTLVGTTEVRQTIDEPIACSGVEREYLLSVYNRYFRPGVRREDIEAEFAGVRPLLRSHDNPTRASREYAIETHEKLVNVFGGKWTTSRLLGQEVADAVERQN